MGKLRWCVALILAAAISLIGPMQDAHAYTLHGYKWNSKSMIVDLRASTSDYRTAFVAAVKEYYANTHLFISYTVADCAPFTGRNGGYGATGWEGQTITVYNASTNLVSTAESKLNGYYLPTTLPAARLKVVALHELGHGLGINHVTSKTDPMYPSASAAYLNGATKISQDMINGINKVYP